jgi:tetratricopeptide (TPR) repeat protein
MPEKKKHIPPLQPDASRDDTRQFLRQRTALLALVLSLAYILLHLAARQLQPEYLFWGINLLNYLPGAAFPLAAVLFPVSLFAVIFFKQRPGATRGRAQFAALLLALLVILWFGRIHAFVLGDGTNAISALITSIRGQNVATRAPLSFLFARAMYSVVRIFIGGSAGGNDRFVSDTFSYTGDELAGVQLGFVIGGLLLFVVFFYAAVFISRYLVREQRHRIWAVLFIVCSGFLPFFAGYVEFYMLPLVLLMVFFLAMVRTLLKDGSPWPPVLAFAAAAAAHVGMLVFLPALLLMLWFVHRTNLKMLLLMTAGTLVLIVGVLFLSGYSPDRFMYIFAAKSTEAGSHFIPLFHTGARSQSYTMFSPYHVTDLANLFLLVNPFGFCLLLMALPKMLKEKAYHNPVGSVLLLSVVLSFIMLFIANCDIGMVADWDALSLFVLPVVLAGLWFFLQSGAPARITMVRMFVAVMAVHSGLWLWTLANDSSSITRLERLQNRNTMSPDGLLYTTNNLSRYYGEKNDFDHITQLYTRLIHELNPEDPRGYFTLARMYIRGKRNRDAEIVLSEAIVKGIADYRIDGAAADLLTERNELRNAVYYYSSSFVKGTSAGAEASALSNTCAGLGYCYYRLQAPDSAVFFWDKALKLDPTNPEASAQLGLFLMQQNEFEKAIPLLQSTIAYVTDQEKKEKAMKLLQYCVAKVGR